MNFKAFAGALILLTTACTSSMKLAPTDVPVLLKSPQLGIAELRYKLLKLENAEIGRGMVSGQRTYLLDYFRQSQDPYFGAERWSPDCLRKNQIGRLHEAADGISFQARLTADEELKTGLCTATSFEVLQLVGYCRPSGTYYEIVLRGDGLSEASFECPDMINFKK